MRFLWVLVVCLGLLVVLGLPSQTLAVAADYPESQFILEMDFDTSTLRNRTPGNGLSAPGSDNWAVTWAADGHQYTTWGDGGGFGGTNQNGRVPLGYARLEGGKDNYSGYNIWGGVNSGREEPTEASFGGKSYGILALDNKLYTWASLHGSDQVEYGDKKLFRWNEQTRDWVDTGVVIRSEENFFSPTFLQFGQNYQGARDDYVYMYWNKVQDRQDWNVQKPGGVYLVRVDREEIEDRTAYEYFTGMSGSSVNWSGNASQMQPVFLDQANGNMRTSVSYNTGLKRYLLMTQQVNRFRAEGARMGVYEAPEPWGPWRTVLYEDPWELGIMTDAYKTVYWNFSNKWASEDGKDFVMIYTTNDEWASIEGSFEVTEDSYPSTCHKIDYNGNLRVDLPDYLAFASHFLTSNERFDFTGDQRVNLDDYLLLAQSFLQSCE